MRTIRRLRGDEGGTILVFVAISLAVLLGLVALSFDLGRMAATQTELQSFADNVALAAAGELDGNADAIDRAKAAASAMITDTQSFGAGGRTLDINDVTLTFMSELDADDTPPYADTVLTAPYDNADARAARFVQVAVTPHNVPMAFASALTVLSGQAATNATVGATAVAGFAQVACQIVHLMFCLPSPSFKADEHIGEMIDLRSARNSAAWGAGDFGFLDTNQIPVNPDGPCAGLNGQKRDACLIAGTGNLSQCFDMRVVDTLPGQRSGQEDAYFNVRFDIYGATMKGERDNPVYAPAPNVIKGMVPSTGSGGGNGNAGSGGGSGGNACNPEVPSPVTSVRLPRDACFLTDPNTCPGGGRFSMNANSWDRAGYIAANHNGTDPATNGANPRTRYQMYLDEIALAGGASSTTRILPATLADGRTVRPETGRPQCSANQSSDPERRVVIAAGIDCDANRFRGRSRGVPVKEYFRMFLTEPVKADGSSPPLFDIWGEIIGSAGGQGSSTDDQFRDHVQLYR